MKNNFGRGEEEGELRLSWEEGKVDRDIISPRYFVVFVLARAAAEFAPLPRHSFYASLPNPFRRGNNGGKHLPVVQKIYCDITLFSTH